MDYTIVQSAANA